MSPLRQYSIASFVVIHLLCLASQLVHGLQVNREPARGDADDDITNYSLRDKPIFDVVLKFVHAHPEASRDVAEKIISSLPDAKLRKELRQEAARVFNQPSTMATDGPTCYICKFVMRVVRVWLSINGDDWNAIEKDTYDYCFFLMQAIDQTIDGREICKTIYYQGPHVAAVLTDPISNLPVFNATAACESLNACFEEPSRDEVLLEPRVPAAVLRNFYQPGTSDIRQKKHRLQQLKLAKKKKSCAIVIAQLTDIHFETDYHSGSAESCGLYVCCLEKHGLGDAGEHGSYLCNVPISTVELFLEKVKEINPDYVIFSGDVPPHTLWEETVESQLQCTETLTASMERIFDGGSVVYPAIGNHEMYPTNLFSIIRLVNETVPMVRSFGELWKNLSGFTQDQIDTMNTGGYYTMLTPNNPDLRIIAINTNYMYTNNFYNTINYRNVPPSINPPTPGRPGEATAMKTAVRTYLINARENLEKVIIINHHPPGNGDYLIEHSKWYEQLMIEFKDVVVLQVAGHTHTDEFKLLKDEYNDVQSMVYVSPSIDTHGWKNPSMRLYFLDESTYELIDIEQHYFNLDDANKPGSAPPEIKKLYSATEEYGLDDMTPMSWAGLLKRFKEDPELLRKHRYHSRAGMNNGDCDERCLRNHVCRQLHANYDHYTVCVADEPLPTIPTTTRTWPPLVPTDWTGSTTESTSTTPTTPTTSPEEPEEPAEEHTDLTAELDEHTSAAELETTTEQRLIGHADNVQSSVVWTVLLTATAFIALNF